MAFGDFPFHVLKDPGAITATSIGLAFSPTLDGFGLTSMDDNTGIWLEHATPSIANSSGGLITTFSVLAADWDPVVEFTVRTPQLLSDLQNARFWIGLFDSKPDTLDLASVPNTARMAAFYFEGGATGLSPWKGVVASGSQKLDLNVGASNVVENTTYTLKITVVSSPSAHVDFSVNGGAATPVNLAPGSLALLGIGIRVTATTAVARKIIWRRASWKPKYA